MLFLDSHLERLLSGADFLFPTVGWISHFESVKQYVEREFNTLSPQRQKESYFRLSIFDNKIHLQHRELLSSPDSLRLTSGLKIKTPGLVPAFVKLSNYVESDLELQRARLRSFDEVVFYDQTEKVTEASTSNLFIVASDGSVLTPAPSSMILDGIIRKKLFQKLQTNDFKIFERSISKTDLLNAREIWLTNSVKGIRFVDQFEELNFEKKDSLFEKAIKIFGRYGELA